MSRKIKKKVTGVAVATAPINPKKIDERTKKSIIVVISAFLAFIILVGAVVGTVIAVREASYVISYKGVGIDEGTATYLTSYFKNLFMKSYAQSGNAAEDNEEFWNKKVLEDTTLGEYLRIETEKYLKEIVAANYLFDKYLKLTADEKRDIELAAEEKLDYLADNSVEKFNEMTAGYGFDYDDFKKGTELLYKFWFASEKLFGSSGENLVEFPDEIEEFYKSYSHVKLLFVRTESDFLLDENGNRVLDDAGNEATVELSAAEKADRLQTVDYIKGVVAKINAGTADVSVFDQLMRDYDGGDRDSHTKGYYFNKNASYTKSFAKEFEKIVNLSYELEIGEIGYTDCSVGVCFIYRIPREDGAYLDTSNDWCFSDFFSNGSNEMFAKMVQEIAEDVELRDKWSNIIPSSIPYQSDYVPRF